MLLVVGIGKSQYRGIGAKSGIVRALSLIVRGIVDRAVALGERRLMALRATFHILHLNIEA